VSLTKKELLRLEEIETKAIQNAMEEVYLDDWVDDEDIVEYRKLIKKTIIR
jgi:hypothetical protein